VLVNIMLAYAQYCSYFQCGLTLQSRHTVMMLPIEMPVIAQMRNMRNPQNLSSNFGKAYVSLHTSASMVECHHWLAHPQFNFAGFITELLWGALKYPFAMVFPWNTHFDFNLIGRLLGLLRKIRVQPKGQTISCGKALITKNKLERN